MAPIDLRSDTVTQPTAEMRRAMAEAEVGDDVCGDDPTVNALEERAAELLGKEAGLFVASRHDGQPRRAQWPTCRAAARSSPAGRRHIVHDEAAGHAVVVGASRPASSGSARTGRSTSAAIARGVPRPERHPRADHRPRRDREHPRPLDGPAARRRRTCARSRRSPTRHGVPLHVDGARFFNAVGRPGRRARASSPAPADTVTFCLSKGLGCPVGSVLVGSATFIARARRARKLLGGGMRQAGVLAAAGLVALRTGRRA